MAEEHRTRVDQLTNENGETEFAFWCDTCQAGGDAQPTKEEARERGQRHERDPSYREWAVPTAQPDVT